MNVVPPINIPENAALNQRSDGGDADMLGEIEADENLSSRENQNPDVFHRLQRPEQRGRRLRGVSPRNDAQSLKPNM